MYGEARVCVRAAQGLLSLDMVELEVLKRSGSANEQRYADKIIPLIRNSHYLLVTLLLNNAAAMEALPIFLDKLVDPVTAIIVSVTAVLFFGEIIPQSICSRCERRPPPFCNPLTQGAAAGVAPGGKLPAGQRRPNPPYDSPVWLWGHGAHRCFGGLPARPGQPGNPEP